MFEYHTGALGIYKEVGLGDSHSLIQSIRDAIQYVNSQEKEPFMSAPEFISTLSDDKCRIPAIADSFGSSEFSDNHDDNRDYNVDDIDRINPSVGTVYVQIAAWFDALSHTHTNFT